MASPLIASSNKASVDKVNILLVDDQPAKLLGYEAILEELDENLIKANSGSEALEQLLKHDIAVMLMDVCMPELDGFELAQMIRQHPRYQRTSIIFVSAIQMTDLDRLRGFECGAVDYVSVPVDPNILRARVAIFADLYRKTRDLERLNVELERRVAERTHALERSEEALREADRRKDEFLAVLSHELRNPLAPIRNAATILATHGASHLSWATEVIDRQVAHLTRLVDDLLDVNRITSGRLQLQADQVTLSEVVGGAIESSRPLVDAGGHELTLALPEQPVHLRVDAVRLTQVFTNLLANAAKYSAPGGRIWVSGEHGGADVVVSIRDAGVGISAEEMPRLFEMFYQTPQPGSGLSRGLGIGLTLARRLVELHGGTLEAQSEGTGRGSTFTVRLPGVVVAAAGSEPVKKARPTGCRRVLVVDDNVDAAESMATLLSLEGHEVRTATDGLEAVRAAEAFRPDVVLLDIGMPGIDGYEVARRIRREAWGTAMRMVAVTGWGQSGDRQRTHEAGFDVHLTKPVELDHLRELVSGSRPVDA